MAINNMYVDPETGELVCELDDKTVAITTTDGKPLSQKNILEKKISNYGNSDPFGIVVRTGRQVDDVVSISSISAEKKIELKLVFKEIRERLLMMLESLLFICDEVDRCNKEFVLEDGPVRLPQVNNLKDKAESFLINGKKAVIEISKMFNVFFDYEKVGSNYDLHLNWTKQRFGENHSIVEVLEYNIKGDHWIKALCDMRNALEHRSKEKWVKIQNIQFDCDRKKMVLPGWSSNESPEPIDMLSNMQIFINNILVMSEDILAQCANETAVNKLFIVTRLPDEEKNENSRNRLKIVKILN